jgi:Phage integrase family
LKINQELADELQANLPFRSPRGRPVVYEGFRSHFWDKTVRGMNGCDGIPFTPHDLRHAHASSLLQHGADLVTVKDRLGHSNISITSRYLHALPSAGQVALDALDKALDRSKQHPGLAKQSDRRTKGPTTPDDDHSAKRKRDHGSTIEPGAEIERLTRLTEEMRQVWGRDDHDAPWNEEANEPQARAVATVNLPITLHQDVSQQIHY